MQNAVGHGKSDLLQFTGQVDPHDTDTAGNAEGHGGEVDNSADSSLDQLIGYCLCMRCRYSNHSQFDLSVANHFSQAVQVANLDVLDMRANLFRVGFKGGDNAESLLNEATIAQESTTEVAHPYECHPPFSIRPKDDLDRANKFLTAVADARVPEVPKVGQILADLGIGEAQLPAKLTATDRLFAIGNQVLKLSQIQAQPANNRLGYGTRIGSK